MLEGDTAAGRIENYGLPWNAGSRIICQIDFRFGIVLFVPLLPFEHAGEVGGLAGSSRVRSRAPRRSASPRDRGGGPNGAGGPGPEAVPGSPRESSLRTLTSGIK